MAAGRVATGFSLPYVARYSANGGVVTYSGARQLARGVNVNLQPESSDDNNCYADNVAAESASGVFTGGTVEFEVDGLFMTSERFIFGLPEAGADGWTGFGDDADLPYLGVGYITRWMSDGVTTYQPTILTKVKFSLPQGERATQEDEIDWQTTSLTASLMRDDSANHNWKSEGASFATEAEALAALQAKLGGVAIAQISALTVGSLTLDPVFAAGTTTYTASGSAGDTEAVSVTAGTGVSVAITFNGAEIASGDNIELVAGANTLVVVASGDGMTTTTYTVAITAA